MREIVAIEVGITTDSKVCVLFRHNDGVDERRIFDLRACKEFISCLETAYFQAQQQHEKAFAGFRDRMGIGDSVDMRLTEAVEDDDGQA